VVWQEVIRLIEDPALIGAELDRRLEAARAAEPTKRRQESLERELARLTKSIDRLVTAYQEELLSLEELRHRMPELRARDQAIRAELQAILDQAADRLSFLRLAETLSAFLARLRETAESLDIIERQRIVRLVVKEVLVDDGAIIIRHSIPVHHSPPGDGEPPVPAGRSSPADRSYLLRSGGVISPLLANIALGVIEERYERWTHHRQKIRAHRRCDPVTAAMRVRMSDRKAGRPVFFPIRYADDFVVLVAGTQEQAEHERAALAEYLLDTMGLELSIEKTRVSDPTEGFEFLGHRVRYKWHPRFGFMPRIEIPTDKRADIRYKVKQLTKRSTIGWSLPHLLQKLNPILRGWGNYFRFCTGASDLFAAIDHYVGDRIWRWLMKKHQSLGRKKTIIRRMPSRLRPTRRLWREGGTEQFLLSFLKVERFRRGWMHAPAYALVPGKPDA